MNAAILALNLGSSSVKFAAFDAASLAPLDRGAISGLGRDARASFLHRASASDQDSAPLVAIADHDAAVAWLVDAIRERNPGMRFAAIGHRVVHGGRHLDRPVHVDSGILDELAALTPLAPAHQPAALAAIRQAGALLPGVPQIACFDTAFHRTQPRLAQWFALPRELSEAGILRYGFHGLSYDYIASVLPGIAGNRAHGRVVVAHLGHGASLCAMRHLRSVATTMGFTTLDGLMMATRCGSVDPGVLLYLLQQRGMGVNELADLLGNRSGLLGVSGISDDVQTLEASGDQRAKDALWMFEDRVAASIASLGTALGGLDVLVFTAGIGEHAAGVRARICGRLAWLGVVPDPDANARHARHVSGPASAVDVFVIPTDEEVVIARAAQQLLGHA